MVKKKKIEKEIVIATIQYTTVAKDDDIDDNGSCGGGC